MLTITGPANKEQKPGEIHAEVACRMNLLKKINYKKELPESIKKFTKVTAATKKNCSENTTKRNKNA